jgi:hypothetical protein
VVQLTFAQKILTSPQYEAKAVMNALGGQLANAIRSMVALVGKFLCVCPNFFGT